MKIKVLYEDKDILAIEKPSGILVHPDGKQPPKSPLSGGHSPSLIREGRGGLSETILDIFKKKYPKLEVVHRLDRETSGVMILAKNEKAHEFLKSQFINREVKKTYVAIVNGWVKNDHGIINKPIGRSPSDFRRWLAGRGARGEMREALTEYKILKRFEAAPSEIFSRFTRQNPTGSDTAKKFQKGQPVKFTYLEVKPKTGRTHQIRVHMKYLNHSVVGDKLYGKGEGEVGRMFLHAKSIEFTNLKGEKIKVESKVPKEFLSMVK